MRTLYNWTAKRAGGRITVYGLESAKHREPENVKIVGVDKIVPAGDGSCCAHVKDGQLIKLAI